MLEILTGFAASVFVMFSGFSIYTYMTTEATRHPKTFESKRAQVIYYWGLSMLVASVASGTVAIFYAIGHVLKGQML